MLDLLQRGLEALYRLEPTQDVREFVVGDEERKRLGACRAPKEQLLVVERDGEVEIGLFVDPCTLDNLVRNDPRKGVGDHNLEDFCLAIEGVSHFVFLAYRAREDKPVKELELELQAEIDKYVTCTLLAGGEPPPDLRTQLYERFRLAPDLSENERQRYEAANAGAARYTKHLERFARRRRIPEMLSELRRFYRMSLDAKLDRIADAA